VVERGRIDYNYCRPHGSLDYATSVGFAGRHKQVGDIRSRQPALQGVHDGGYNNDRAEYTQGMGRVF
jgi:hypothetical protein